jgi:hypothetical protein
MEQDDIARARALPLEAVLGGLGAQRDPKDPAHNWRIGSSRITVTGTQFYDHNAAGALHRMHEGRAGGGGAIDLMQYLKDVGFREAVRELGGLAGTRQASISATGPAAPVPASSDTRPRPSPAADRAARAHWYLTVARMIPDAIVEREMRSGRVFADVRGNVVFRLRDEAGQEVGYEVRGTYEKPYHSVHGEKGLFITKADETRSAAFVESGIEALSYRALRGVGLTVSTTGSAIEKPASMARLLQARGYEIVTAFKGCLPKLAKSSGFLWITFPLDHYRRGDILRSSPSEGSPCAYSNRRMSAGMISRSLYPIFCCNNGSRLMIATGAPSARHSDRGTGSARPCSLASLA